MFWMQHFCQAKFEVLNNNSNHTQRVLQFRGGCRVWNKPTLGILAKTWACFFWNLNVMRFGGDLTKNTQIIYSIWEYDGLMFRASFCVANSNVKNPTFHDDTTPALLAMAGFGFTMWSERFSVAQSGLGSLDVSVVHGVDPRGWWWSPYCFPGGFLTYLANGQVTCLVGKIKFKR